ncbi:MAG: hypothetical protein ACRC6O_04150 [Flavobacterium sp.]
MAQGLDEGKRAVPEEILATTSWLSPEVSGSHSTCGKRVANRYRTGLTNKEGLEETRTQKDKPNATRS